MQKIIHFILQGVQSRGLDLSKARSRRELYPHLLQKWNNYPKEQSGPGGNTRIIGGDSCEPHEYPSQVALLVDGIWFCGGSVIGMAILEP